MAERASLVKRAADVRCVAGILVGGRSIRMGRPKSTLPLPNGRVLVEHVAGVARKTGRWIEEVVILGDGVPAPASLTHLTVLPDTEPDAGPLAGLLSLLRHSGERWALLLACDMPLVTPLLLEHLCTAARPDRDAVAFRRPDRPNTWHACCALYHPRLLPAALSELIHGSRRLQHLLAKAHTLELEPTPAEQQMLMNLNTPQDYDRLLHSA
jgi:molybdopterin-guanine dinucleotide biosynthesis protein A